MTLEISQTSSISSSAELAFDKLLVAFLGLLLVPEEELIAVASFVVIEGSSEVSELLLEMDNGSSLDGESWLQKKSLICHKKYYKLNRFLLTFDLVDDHPPFSIPRI